MNKEIELGGNRVAAHFALTAGKQILACGFFGRSKTKIKAVGQSFNSRTSSLKWYTGENNWRCEYLDIGSDEKYKGYLTTQRMKRDRFTYCLVVSGDIGKQYLVTTKERELDDLYEYLMVNYRLPLLREWSNAIMHEFLNVERNLHNIYTRVYREGDDMPELPLGDVNIPLDQVVVYKFREIMKESDFETIISRMLRKGTIRISDKEIPSLHLEGMDDYFTRFGAKVVDNLEKSLSPLTDLKPNVSTLAIKEKSLFPQQAAVVEGIMAMEEAGISYAIQNEGMGTGKTLQAAAACEAISVKKWLKHHPGAELRDAYLEPETICYRVVIMAPGHLVAKWKEEIETEIPHARATIVNSLSQFVALRDRPKPVGREFYIFSKDFAKLDSMNSPIPTQIKKKSIALAICSDCKEEGEIYFKKGAGTEGECPHCNGKNFEPYTLDYIGRHRGLMCPHCGQLLLQYKGYDTEVEDFDTKIVESVLTPPDFASGETKANSKCYHCGGSLWGTNAKPVCSNGATPKTSKWYRVSHKRNHAGKSTVTVNVLKGHEDEYKRTCVTTEGWKISGTGFGPRKVAPADYIKKYLKGYFDFAILDECHKYLGASAQGRAAHIISQASKFTLLLTGTISNGMASCFYNLFWMMEPERMRKMGYGYSNGELSRFCKEFGCVETVYEAGSYDASRKAMSRGRQISSPKVKPGISPVLFGKMLMDRCLYLDISDLSKYLPKLKEEVVVVEAHDEVLADYNRVLNTLKEASQGRTGQAALSEMLQFGLSYLDKPYDRNPVKDPFVEDAILCKIPNHPEYADGMLLPKEEKLIEVINEEVANGRNVFVYATFTGKPETNICYRLKEVIEKHCNLTGMVEIIHSTSPKAKDREEWFHKRASEGIKVFITNPANVETGLDFCFKHEGKEYNYPTLIFYQMGYQLATIWQASRRAYRLNQRKDCRTMYFAYEGSLQAAALAIMAKKQQATAAIQGKFSSDGLSSMAKGVDMRTQLAQALAENDMSDRHSIENMFDALSQAIDCSDPAYDGYRPSPTYWELVGKSKLSDIHRDIDDIFGSVFGFDFDAFGDADSDLSVEVEEEKKTVDSDFELLAADLVGIFDDDVADLFGFDFDIEAAPTSEPAPMPVRKGKKSKKNDIAGQFDLFSFAS